MEGLLNGVFQGLLTMLVIVLLLVGSGAFFIGKLIYKKNYVESTKKIIPDYRLEVKNKTVDTIWIYKIKK